MCFAVAVAELQKTQEMDGATRTDRIDKKDVTG